MSSLNLGNATVGYAYKYPLKGSAFNKVFRNILSPGIYNGGILSYVANNISVTAYDALFNTNTNQLLAVHTDSTIDLSGTAPTGFGLGSITTLTPYIAMSFTWADSTTTYPDYLFSDNSILSNPTYLIIGKATFSGSVVIGFDYSEATYPPVYNSTSKVLQVRGGLTSESTLQGTQLISTVSTGTPPIAVTSTTKVVNLNVEHADEATNALACSGNAATATTANGLVTAVHDVTATRANNTTYTNTTGKSIFLYVVGYAANTVQITGNVTIDSVVIENLNYMITSSFISTRILFSAVVPTGSTYLVIIASDGGTKGINSWFEIY
jgi:hypothetical protein